MFSGMSVIYGIRIIGKFILLFLKLAKSLLDVRSRSLYVWILVLLTKNIIMEEFVKNVHLRHIFKEASVWVNAQGILGETIYLQNVRNVIVLVVPALAERNRTVLRVLWVIKDIVRIYFFNFKIIFFKIRIFSIICFFNI